MALTGPGVAGAASTAGGGGGFDWGKWLPVIIPSAAAGITGYLGYRAAGNATNAQTQSAQQSLGLLKDIYGQNRADTAPWRQAGGTALNQLMRGLQGRRERRRICAARRRRAADLTNADDHPMSAPAPVADVVHESGS